MRDFVRDVKLVLRSKKSRKDMMERLPQGEEGLDDKYGVNRNDTSIMTDEDEIDIDWTTGWSRIEKYLELVEDGSKSSTDESDDNRPQLRNRNNSSAFENNCGNIELEHLVESNDLILSVEQVTTHNQTSHSDANERNDSTSSVEAGDEQRSHEFV